MLDSIVDGATEIVGTVAKGVAPEVVAVIDVNGVVQEIDVQALLEKVDMNAILDRIDIDLLLDRLDVQALVERLDVERIVAKVDVNAVLEQVDLDALVERTQIGSLIARTGAGAAAKVVDVARSQGVGLDSFVQNCMNRLLRRDRSVPLGGPPLLVDREPLTP
jgi:hydrogenase maturation factor